jgi:hypothetical protein
VEGLELDVWLAVAQHLHDDLQVALVADVPHHDAKVVAVQQELRQQLQALPLQHIVLRGQQPVVQREKLRVAHQRGRIAIRVQALEHQRLVGGQQP